MAKKIVIAILSFILVGALAFCIIWGVTNYDAVKQAMSGTSLYTKEDIDKAYQDGYDTAFEDKQEYLTLIEQYRISIDELTAEKQALSKEIELLELELGETTAELYELRIKHQETMDRLAELEITLKSYEDFIKEVENSNKLVATFMVDGAVYKLQQYNSGDTVSVENPENKSWYTFKGWMLDGEPIDLTSFVITENTTFTADLEVISLNFELVTENDVISRGQAVWTDGTNVYYSDAYVLNKETSTWEETSWNISFNGNRIWTDGENIYCSDDYVLNKETSTWERKEWLGLTSFEVLYGDVWTDGANTYYSNSTQQYVLNRETSTWEVKEWFGLTDFRGMNIWTDGENVYYSDQYVLNKETSTWEETSWNIFIGTGFEIWHYGENTFAGFDYVLDKENMIWKQIEWNLSSDVISYPDIWTDGESIYYTYQNSTYKLIKGE